jgi:hypothetical protein
LTLTTSIRVDGIAGEQIFDFLADPNDRAYQRWWPGTHLQLHPLERHADHVGDLIYMDEYVGRRRLRMTAIVVEASRGRRLVWRLRKVVRLPAWLILELADYQGGVAITHTVQAGFRGAGRILDPVIGLILSREFAEALDDHVRTEFPLLRDRFDELNALSDQP